MRKLGPDGGQWPGQGHLAACALRESPLLGDGLALLFSVLARPACAWGFLQALWLLHIPVARLIHNFMQFPVHQICSLRQPCAEWPPSPHEGGPGTPALIRGSPRATQAPALSSETLHICKWVLLSVCEYSGLITRSALMPTCQGSFWCHKDFKFINVNFPKPAGFERSWVCLK